MTTQQICEAAETNKECLFYFGDNIASFCIASVALFGEEQAEKFMSSIYQHKGCWPSDELELVLRTKDGYLDGWNTSDSIKFYKINFRNQTSGWRKEAKVFDCRHQKAVIL